MRDRAVSLVSSTAQYCTNLAHPARRRARVIDIGGVPLGGSHPIRLQSMTTTDTMDVDATVAQVLRLVEAGSEYVRLTVPSKREAEALTLIKERLQAVGCRVPLIADVHFTPKAAEIAALYVEKVRINPGNYADKKRFAQINYTEATYQAELERIAERIAPLIAICKQKRRVLRIGTNHGSLSDRIMSRYGDTPLGMVESALEFVRMCKDMQYEDLVISMKASQPRVMIHAYRLLVERLTAEKLGDYPLHLGVTEAGDGEDGRLKSALGIGALLCEGLGDTVRVSLTEAPECELPVADALCQRYGLSLSEEPKEHNVAIPDSFDPFSYHRRHSHRVLDWGDTQLPRVAIDASQYQHLEPSELYKQLGYTYQPELDKWESSEQAPDYIYTGHWGENLALPPSLRHILHYKCWEKAPSGGRYPLLFAAEIDKLDKIPRSTPVFILAPLSAIDDLRPHLQKHPKLILWLQLPLTEGYVHLRKVCFSLQEVPVPVGLLLQHPKSANAEALLLQAAVHLGGCFIDGYGDGLLLQAPSVSLEKQRHIAFGVLQAARLRLSKTEYIACPSCGRTLFDLEETTARIRSRTSHLKGLKIGIMGCIVNGPGEMADADFGYVGSGTDRITLYKGKEVVRRNIPTKEAVEALISLIKDSGKWQAPPVAAPGN